MKHLPIIQWQVVEPITVDEASAIDSRVSSDNLVSARLSDGNSFC